MEELEVRMRCCGFVPLLVGCAVGPSVDDGVDRDEPGRWLVRLEAEIDGPCPSVDDAGGTWSGEPLRGPAGEGSPFCVYQWASAGGVNGDPERLDAVAMDGFVVPDERTRDDEASALGWVPGPHFREGVSGCDVCVSWQDDFLWVVLPPGIFGWSLNGLYAPEVFEEPAEQVFWGSVPEDLFGEDLYVTW